MQAHLLRHECYLSADVLPRRGGSNNDHCQPCGAPTALAASLLAVVGTPMLGNTRACLYRTLPHIIKAILSSHNMPSELVLWTSCMVLQTWRGCSTIRTRRLKLPWHIFLSTVVPLGILVGQEPHFRELVTQICPHHLRN